MLGKIIGGALGSLFGPVGTVVGVAVGHKIDSTLKNTENSSTPSSIASQSTFNERLLRGPFCIKGEVFALSLYFPISVDRELHNSDVFSKAISDMKFNYRYSLIPLFADSIKWFIQKTEIHSDIDCIVTCPTSTIRSKQPLEMIASRVSELTSLPYYRVLTKDGQSLKQKSYEERKEAARSIRLIDPTYIKGKRVLLIDDIITSGSTMRASKERLLEGGAVDVVSLAILTTADAYPPQKLELMPRSMNSNKTLSERIKESAVNLYLIFENGKSRIVYYDEYQEYQKQQAKIYEEHRKIQEQKYREEEERKKEAAKKEEERRLERENQHKQQLTEAIVTGNREQLIHLLKPGLRLNNSQPLIQALKLKNFEIIKEYIDRFPNELTHEVLFACLEYDMPIDLIKDHVKAWHTNQRRDAIIKAVNEGRLKVVIRMKDLNFNFNFNVRDNMGNSLYEIAKKKGHNDISKFLKS
ncbi:ComF family protein [Brevibacillus borstelensis]|uniref:ComF family protein n=1 Tax=Brevibacillus borstelensis TaxID=45462 RepID=UPI002E1CE819|nr:phosphoribosyltransferase family protein [Brevibacillus borstelensis]MED1747175.1 phosphoribosyltransferase family protein [Brevibacillus borstelensis]